MEVFQYLVHPVTRRVPEVVEAGEVGRVEHVETMVAIPAPADTDPRWSLELAGGAVVDFGCHGLHAHEMAGPLAGGCPSSSPPDPGSAPGTVGSAGEVMAHNFVQPHTHDRRTVIPPAGSRTEALGRRASGPRRRHPCPSVPLQLSTRLIERETASLAICPACCAPWSGRRASSPPGGCRRSRLRRPPPARRCPPAAGRSGRAFRTGVVERQERGGQVALRVRSASTACKAVDLGPAAEDDPRFCSAGRPGGREVGVADVADQGDRRQPAADLRWPLTDVCCTRNITPSRQQPAPSAFPSPRWPCS